MASSGPVQHLFACLTPVARVLDPARWRSPPGWDAESGSQAHHEVGFIASGRGTWTVDDGTLRLEPGCAYLLCPGSYSRLQVPRRGGGMTGWKITFEWSALERRDADAERDLAIGQLAFVPPSARRELHAAFAGVQRAYLDGGQGWEPLATGHLLALLALLARIAPTAGPAVPRGIDRRLAAAVDYMRSNRRRPFKIAAVAQAAGLSEDYFRRLFHEVVGVPPQAYAQRLRLAEARRILAEQPSTPIARACREAGFGDAKHFARLFRRRFASSPREFRARLLSLRRRLGHGGP